MDFGIAGKVAFVAGASKGMGRATAQLLATEGCKVAVVARDPGAIHDTVAEIEAAGGAALGISADLGVPDGVDAAIAELEARWGLPDIVVGQMSDSTHGSFTDTKAVDYERVFRAFTLSQVWLAKATIPTMRARGWGRYVHIGGMNGKEPQLSHPHIVQNTVRPSTVAFLRVLAEEAAPDGVTVNGVGPGLTATPTLARYIRDNMGLTDERGAAWLRGEEVPEIRNGQKPAAIPMGRAGRPEEVGALVAFLASQQAGYITGEWIAVDGGRHRFAF
jgi:3-oxoacyl-[acyl-carrier protein] reductase